MIWEHSQELYLNIPYKRKVGQPDVLQHNGITNYETILRTWIQYKEFWRTWKQHPMKMGSTLHQREVIRQCFLWEAYYTRERSLGSAFCGKHTTPERGHQVVLSEGSTLHQREAIRQCFLWEAYYTRERSSGSAFCGKHTTLERGHQAVLSVGSILH